MSTHFVTGATGAVGSAVVARLLEEPDQNVVALVRGESDAAAAARLRATLAALDVRETAMAGDRLRVAMGDVELPRFGLSDDGYADVLRSCTHVIHCAGAVRMNLPLEAARTAAVGSARSAIEMAQRLHERGRLVKAEMVSTVGVAGRAHRLLKEEWVGIAHAFHNTYEQAKAEAEVEIRAAIDAGLPMTVHRPSMVVGDSRTGRTLTFQVFYFIAEFLSGRRTSGFFPALGDARLDTVPVDAVASAIVHSSRSVETAGRILHLCAGPAEAMSLARLQEIVRERMRQRGEHVPRARYVPRPLFRAAARALGRFVGAEHRAALGTLPVFLDYLDTDQRFDDTRTRAWLAKERIAVPDTEDYVPRVVDFYLARRRRGAHAKAA